MIELAFSVQRHILTRTDNTTITTNSKHIHRVNFTFSSEWEGTEKAAVFRQGNSAYNVILDDNDSCVVPAEVLKSDRAVEIHVSVYGIKDDTTITSTIATIHADAGSRTGGDMPCITPTMYEQIMSRLAGMESGKVNDEHIMESIERYLSEHPVSGTVTDEDLISTVERYVDENCDSLKGEKGDKGPKGDKGKDGNNGKSAYEIACDNGFTGTESEWLASLGGSGEGIDLSEYVKKSELLEYVIPEGLSTDDIRSEMSDAEITETVYDLSHLILKDPQWMEIKDGVYIFRANKSGNTWANYFLYDEDLKASNGVCKVTINVTEINGTYRHYLIYNKKNGQKQFDSTKTISKAGTYTFDVDLNYYAVYKDYDGSGIDFCLANVDHNTDESMDIVMKIDRYDTTIVRAASGSLSDSLLYLNSKIDNLDKTGKAETQLASPNGAGYLLQVNNDGSVVAVPKLPSNILYIGNSLLGGFGNHGMASTTVEDDYYAKVNAYLTDKGKTLETQKLQGGTFEAATTDEAANDWITGTLAPLMSEDRDLVIVQLGDNVNTTEKNAEFKTSCGVLCSYIREHCPKARVAWVGMWYSTAERLDVIKNACEKYGCVFVDIHDLISNEENKSYIGAKYIDNSGKEKEVEVAGVASHPGDKGFTQIANRIIKALFE